jgi:hypothetical protein
MFVEIRVSCRIYIEINYQNCIYYKLIFFLIHSEELKETPLLLLSGFGLHMLDKGLGRGGWEGSIDILSVS